MHINIGGFQKNTLIDFPGVVASLVFTQGCNFRCPYCHNPGLVPFYPFQINSDQSIDSLQENPNGKTKEKYNLTVKLIDPNEIFAFLKKRKGLIDGVAISGGEPTLQPGLENFCLGLKNMGLKVKLDTNGSRPDVIETLIKRELLDFVAMDIKSNRAGYQYIVRSENYSLPITSSPKFEFRRVKLIKFDFSPILKSIKLIMKRAPAYEFRTTCIRPFVSQEIIAEIGEMIKGASHYVLQHCSKNVQMLNPDFFQKQNPYPDPFLSDHEINRLEQTAQTYVQCCSIR